MIYDHKSSEPYSDNYYGDVVIGASFRFVVTLLSDNKKILAGSQLV